MPRQLIPALLMPIMREPALEILAWEHLILEINNVKLWEDTCQFLILALSRHSCLLNMEIFGCQLKQIGMQLVLYNPSIYLFNIHSRFPSETHRTKSISQK